MTKFNKTLIVINFIIYLTVAFIYADKAFGAEEITQETQMLLDSLDDQMADSDGLYYKDANNPDTVRTLSGKEKAPGDFEDSSIDRKLKNGKTQKFDGNEYMIVRRNSGKKKAAASPKHSDQDNRVSVLFGKGPYGNLRDDGSNIQTDSGKLFGLQYMRTVDRGEDYDFHLLIQVQSNKTVSGGFGVGF